MIIKRIKNDNLDFTYSYYEYPYLKNYIVKIEIERYKYLNKLNKYFRIYFNNSRFDISWIFIKNVSLNYCNLDPLFSIINKQDFIKTYNIKDTTINLDQNLKLLNHKVIKYILKLYTFVLKLKDEDYNIIIKTHENNIILYVENFEDDTYIMINKDIYYKMQKRFDGNKNLCNNLIWTVLFRYKYLDILYYGQGKMQDSIYYELCDKYNIDVELFGSAFNSTLKYFCSLFYDIEKYFGSIGNFFSCDFIKGFYYLSPPYDTVLMHDTFDKIQYFLIKPNTELSFFTLLPVWFDKEEYDLLNSKCQRKEILFNNAKQIINDKNNIVYLLKKSKYNIFNKLYCKGTIEFINIEKKRIKEDFENNENVMILSNTLKKINLDVSLFNNDIGK